jgi:hypothetical protein
LAAPQVLADHFAPSAHNEEKWLNRLWENSHGWRFVSGKDLSRADKANKISGLYRCS